MLDIKLLREQLNEIAAQLARRGFILDKEKFLALETQRKTLQVRTQELQNSRNALSKTIGQRKAQNQPIDEIKQQVDIINAELTIAETQLDQLLSQLNAFLAEIPNLLQADVPEGKDENSNQEIRRWGEIPSFDFIPKDHVALGEALGVLDFNNAAKITGARFVIMHGKMAKLHRALIQFMLDIHTQQHGYQEIYVPYIVNRDSLFGTGQLPKFEEDLFGLRGDQGYYLIPTAEVPVTNIIRDTVLSPAQFPLKYVCHTPCFRSEAGSYGKDTRGMIRHHQFEKVELVQFTLPENSQTAHEELTHHAEIILQKLGLPYRVMKLCAGDTGFASSKTYDLEVWLPGQQKFREISSCSNFQSFHARRMQARFKNAQTNKTELVHTLNGSGLPIGRTLVALIENYQDVQGNIHLPEVLWPYMGGVKIIDKN